MATALATMPLAAQARFGQLQYQPPKGTVAESPAAVIVTDSSGSSLCRYGILSERPATGDPRADHAAALRDAARVLGATAPSSTPRVLESRLASGHVQRISESTMPAADGSKRTLRLLTLAGGGTQGVAFVQYTSFLRCVLRVSAFESSLVPLWPATGAVVATGAPPASATTPAPPATTPAPRASPAPPAAPPPAVTPPAGGAIGTRGWAFTSTNFADGWTATVAEDWVLGRKGDVTVHLHHPRAELDEYLGSMHAELVRAWNALVVPRYRDITDWVVEVPGMTFPERVIGRATATDAATGRRVFVAMVKLNQKGQRYVEVVTPDQATFERTYGSYAAGRLDWDALFALQGMNRFAVARSDLQGEWSSNFAAAYELRSIATGAYMGAYTTGGSTTVVVAGDRYRMTSAGASGTLGNMRTGKQEDTGTLTLPDQWSIHFGGMTPGRRDRYWAHFESVKGGRILVMGAPGEGQASLTLVKVK